MAVTSVLERIEADLSSIDVDLLSAGDAASLVPLLARLEHRLGALKLGCGRRGVQSAVHLRSGARDGASWFSSLTGVSVGVAKASLQTVSRLDSLPQVQAAFQSGSLSLEQARLVAEAASSDPGSEALLLKAAQVKSMVGLKRECRGVSARSGENEASRYESLRKKRYLRTWTSSDGMVCGSFALMADEGALLLARLKPFVEASFKSAYRSGTRESHDAYRADGLVALVETSGTQTRSARAELVVIASYESLVRGWVEEGESCEIEGVGPVPVALARSLAGDCYLSGIVMKDDKPALVKGKGHYIPDRLRVAVKMRDRCCVVPGCDSIFRLEVDHTITVADGGPTVLDNLALLCRDHHRHKTFRGFELKGEPGNWQWIAPTPVGETPATPVMVA